MNFIKKHSKLLIFILVCLSIFLIFKVNDHNNINYTSLGDGFALGENAYGQIDYGYSDYVKDYLSQTNKLNRYVKSFSTTSASINSLSRDITVNKKIVQDGQTINLKQTLRETNILTISIGLNDLIYQLSIAQNPQESTVEKIISDIEKDFNQLVAEIEKYYTKDIYVIGYYNIYQKNKIYTEAIKKLNQIYQNNDNVIYIDIYDLFENNPNFHQDILNKRPNTQGYEHISRLIITKIEKELEK